MPGSWMEIEEEDRHVNPQLGYPRAYAKLCRHAHTWMQQRQQGLILPFSNGPPRTFFPYALSQEEAAKLEDLESLFPVVREDCPEDLDLKKYSVLLWQKLDHLGNAGFDPEKFRVDPYGNVLYWNADSASPLAWEICHWFPYSRGGKTVINNLRIVHWQVAVVKKSTLEFLIPWWDLQSGISVNFFISAFASGKKQFRDRCISFFFSGGENPLEDHAWPRQFGSSKSCGLAAAALVRQHKDSEDVLRISNAVFSNLRSFASPDNEFCTEMNKRWTAIEEDTLLKAVEKYGLGSWKEIKECEPLLSHRTLIEIRDKYRCMIGMDRQKENAPNPIDRQSIVSSALNKELKLRIQRQEEKQAKAEEMGRLEDSLRAIREANQKEKEQVDSLENELRAHRKQVEKQRQWNESQSSYRLCVERMIQETMHRSLMYKEEARLNQAACNSLLAQLESQSALCGTLESDFMKTSKQREALISPNLSQAASPLRSAINSAINSKHTSPSRLPSFSFDLNPPQPVPEFHLPPAKSPVKLNRKPQQKSPLGSRNPNTLSENLAPRNPNVLLENLAPRNPNILSENLAPRDPNIMSENLAPVSDKPNCIDSENEHLGIINGKKHKFAAHSKRQNKSTLREHLREEDDEFSLASQPIKPQSEISDQMPKTSTIKLNSETWFDPTNLKAENCQDSIVLKADLAAAEEPFKLQSEIWSYSSGKKSKQHSRSCSLDVELSLVSKSDESCSADRFSLDPAVELNAEKADEEVDQLLQEVLANHKNSVAAETENCADEEECDEDERMKRIGKSTIDKWLQALLLSTEPTISGDKSEQDHEEIVKKNETCDEEIMKKNEAETVKDRQVVKKRNCENDKGGAEQEMRRSGKGPLVGLLRKLSFRQQSLDGTSFKNRVEDKKQVCVGIEEKKQAVTFDDWEGLTSQMAEMKLGNTQTDNLEMKRTKSERKHTVSYASESGLKGGAKSAARSADGRVRSVDGKARSGDGKVMSAVYYSTGSFDPKQQQQQISIKARARRQSIEACAEAWRSQVHKLK